MCRYSRMVNYAVRVSRSFQEFFPAVQSIADVVEKSLIYEHVDASRVHIHMLLVGCTVSTDTLKNYIKKELGVVNSRDWSFKTAKEEYGNYVKYMSKGVYIPKFNKGFEESYVEEWKNKWVVNKVEKVERKSKQTEYDLQIMIEELLWPMNCRNENGEMPKVSKDDILKATMEVLNREKKFAFYQRVARLCQAVRWRFHPTECEKMIFKMF